MLLDTIRRKERESACKSIVACLGGAVVALGFLLLLWIMLLVFTV